MNVRSRNLHMFYFTSIVLLALTGFLVKVPVRWIPLLAGHEAWWFEVRALVHRVAGAVFVYCCLYHFGYHLVTRFGRRNLWQLLPTYHDLINIFLIVPYSLGLTKKRPRYGRFDHIEKLEYWTMWRASLLISVTGVIIWVEELFSPYLFHNARLVHKWEALAAVFAIMIWQAFNLHPEFYLYRRRESLPCCREECVQCACCVNLVYSRLGDTNLNRLSFYQEEMDLDFIKELELNAKKIKKMAHPLCNADNLPKAAAFREAGCSNCQEAHEKLDPTTTCTYGCVGLGDCIGHCPKGAIAMGASGVPVVDLHKCVGCGKCARKCPQKVIATFPRFMKVHVQCRSQLETKSQREVCKKGCIACKSCEKFCPFNAIQVRDKVAVTDYSRCRTCGICAMKCPKKVILDGKSAGRRRAYIADNRCVGCDICRMVCPLQCIEGGIDVPHHVDHDRCVGCEICFWNCPGQIIDMIPDSKPVALPKGYKAYKVDFYNEHSNQPLPDAPKKKQPPKKAKAVAKPKAGKAPKAGLKATKAPAPKAVAPAPKAPAKKVDAEVAAAPQAKAAPAPKAPAKEPELPVEKVAEAPVKPPVESLSDDDFFAFLDSDKEE